MALFREIPENPDGIVGVGGDLKPETLLYAYRRGIFPWPMEGYPLTWFSPPERAILEFRNLHVPRSLERARRQSRLHFTFDQAFSKVIRHCAQVPRPGQDGTWITSRMVTGYQALHALGAAHSAEAWNGDQLVAGLYGVDVDGAFAAESMFHLQANASKLLLLTLFEHLGRQGLDWIDIQVLTPHLEALGARAIPRSEFLERLAKTRARGLKLFPAQQPSSP